MNSRVLLTTVSRVILFLTLAFCAAGALAERPAKIKLGTLAPKGTFYHRALQEMGEKWRHAQGNKARFIIYTDGSQGGEADTVRRMRIGQLNAALLSIVGLSKIDKSVTALQIMPMMFHSWEEVDYVREKLRPELEKRLLAKGFVALFWAEGGWVRFFAKKPAVYPEDFKDRKIFTWAGNNAQVNLMKTLGYRPVVLEVNDILPALQTGLINVVPTTVIHALAGQLDGPAPYMLDIKWVPIVGAAVITRKAWEAMTPQARKVLAAAADKVAGDIRARRETQEREAITAMQRRGLHVQHLTAEPLNEWRTLAAGVYPQIRGAMVPADIFDRVQQLLAEYRGTRQ